MIARFASFDTFAAFFRAHARTDRKLGGVPGELTGAESIARALAGSTEDTLPALPFDASSVAVDMGEDLRPRLVRDVAGSSPIVPAFLSGHPLSMRRRKPTMAPARRVSIYVSLALSIGVTPEAYARRGAVVCGLVEALQTIGVTVDLLAYEDAGASLEHASAWRDREDRKPSPGVMFDWKHDGNTLTIVPLGTSPIMISRVAHVLGSADYARNVMYSANDVFGRGLSWSRAFLDIYPSNGTARPEHHDAYTAGVASRAGAGPMDLVLPPAYFGDPMLKRPEEWIRGAIARVMHAHAAA